MVKPLEELFEEIRALPEDRRADIAFSLAVQLGHEVELQEWHKEILRERLAEMEKNPDEGIPAELVFEELRQRWRK